MTESALVEIPQENLLTLFTTNKGFDPIIKDIMAEVDKFKPDLSTVNGRKQIASMANKIARSKVVIDDAGKGLVDKLKEQPKLIDIERKRVRDFLDTLKQQVRQPLTDWEDVERARIENITNSLAAISTYKEMELVYSSDAEAELEIVRSIVIDDSFDEFEEQALVNQELAISKLTQLATSLKITEDAERKVEADRIEAEKKTQVEREIRIAKDAAERATKEAGEKAQEAAGRSKRIAEEDARQKKETAEKRELELKLQAERAEREKAEAIQKAKDAEADAAAKVEAEKQVEKDAAEKRESDAKHKKKINNEALTAMVKNGIPEAVGKKVIVLIAKGEIPNVSIYY